MSATPADIATAKAGDRIEAWADGVRRLYIVRGRRFGEVQAESMINGAPVTICEDSCERGTLVLVSGAGTRRIDELTIEGAS